MSIIDSFSSRYKLDTPEQANLALREIVQEIALLGLWRSHFFEHAVFYGGTALRILYGLDRYSEDLDFSLTTPDPAFKLSTYYTALNKELKAFGLESDIVSLSKKNFSAIKSAFIKMDTRVSILNIGLPPDLASRFQHNQRLKIKFEIDTNPPSGSVTDVKYQYIPQAYSIKAYNLASMFAGKLHALIARNWKNRVKGRDWYDLVWFIGRDVVVNTFHLQQRLFQTGHLNKNDPHSPSEIQSLLLKAVDMLDIKEARKDVLPFLRDEKVIEIWSREFFYHTIQAIRFDSKT